MLQGSAACCICGSACRNTSICNANIFVFQVGVAVCQIARAYGLKVLGTAGSVEGQSLALQNGAHEVFNHNEVNYIDKIKVKLSTIS